MHEITVTEEGLKKLTDELDYLKTVKKQEVKDAIKTAKEFGDLSENSEYEAARTEQAQVEGRITELEEMLKHVHLVSADDVTHDRVSVGVTVTVKDVDKDQKIEYMLVGSTEADPFANKISDTSPIGKAIIGAKVGDRVTVHLPRRDLTIIIEKIEKSKD
ncbi:MAG: transcription elongation factor GreA [Clostridia bacterium]|nr:transcription elongation factor GreA [Clostridia bacterium]